MTSVLSHEVPTNLLPPAAMGTNQGLIPPETKPVVVRQVWADNLEYEFSLIRIVVGLHYQFVSVDTEFPGVIFVSSDRQPLRDPREQYRLMKMNVDATKLIQVGLTFADAYGNFPDLGTQTRFIWEFNFREFDIARDPHKADSVALLRCQGIDFERNQKDGIEANRFAELMIMSGLIGQSFTWVTFHGAYDFAYLVKVLMRGRQLPARLEDFLLFLRVLFGDHVYDVKHMMRFCSGLYGGLERVAKTLQVDRAVGSSHQAGSDSLLTWRTFEKMVNLFFVKAQPEGLARVLYGLEIDQGKA